MGSEHSGEGDQKPIHEPNLRIISIGEGEPLGPTAFVAPPSVKKKAEPVGRRGSDERSCLPDIQASYRGILPSSPGFYSKLFVIPKNTGGLQPVLDLRKLDFNV
ncbi:hypothetical protein AYI69_g6510 [Smittium culicis]|uniref:Uncharacterized protein n=1 Tax=Smittium culicis TaxID=133412 RepID=A0A1R1XYX6_9FUNG|nr:hypothetical protein AYI69_g6510 [Smittium culicis]